VVCGPQVWGAVDVVSARMSEEAWMQWPPLGDAKVRDGMVMMMMVMILMMMVMMLLLLLLMMMMMMSMSVRRRWV
jgi:hypothetical protein